MTANSPPNQTRERQFLAGLIGRDILASRSPWLHEREAEALGVQLDYSLFDFAARNPGFRLLPDNFYGVEQSIIVQKGNTALLDVVQNFLDEARSSGVIASSIQRAGLNGVDVAPQR